MYTQNIYGIIFLLSSLIFHYQKIDKYKRKYQGNISVGKKITDRQKIIDKRFTDGEFSLVIPSVN
jgi:hypothetical protein